VSTRDASGNFDEAVVPKFGGPTVLYNPVRTMGSINTKACQCDRMVDRLALNFGIITCLLCDETVARRFAAFLAQAEHIRIDSCLHWTIVVKKCRQLVLTWGCASRACELAVATTRNLLTLVVAAGIVRDWWVHVRASPVVRICG